MVAPVVDAQTDDLIAPDAETWRNMSDEQRRRFIERVHAALDEQRDAMTEGRPHFRAKSRALDMLGRHFRRIGRRVYLASEMPVLYPGERIIQPDLMAVLDVDDPGDDDERTAWVVQNEGKGPEFVLEVHFLGDERKDFVRNVEEYARLGIEEYFIDDRRRQSLVGYRLASSTRPYERVHMRFGRFSSTVLGLDLQVRGGRLRFYQGDAELPDSDELIERVELMLDDLTRRRDEAQERVQQEQERALSDLRTIVFEVLAARGLTLTDGFQEQVRGCTNSATLRGWAIRAGTAASLEEVLEADEGRG
ncbi:MAG: Uma2 family endonuclease [Myxococcota bacterium]